MHQYQSPEHGQFSQREKQKNIFKHIYGKTNPPAAAKSFTAVGQIKWYGCTRATLASHMNDCAEKRGRRKEGGSKERTRPHPGFWNLLFCYYLLAETCFSSLCFEVGKMNFHHCGKNPSDARMPKS